jgi:hypothetical protein
MSHNKPNKPSSPTEPQALQWPQPPDELILKLLPTLDKKQLARVVNGIADVVLTSEILN